MDEENLPRPDVPRPAGPLPADVSSKELTTIKEEEVFSITYRVTIIGKE